MAANYFIYGDEPYLIEEKTKEIIKTLRVDTPELYIDMLSSEISLTELLMVLNTIPLGFYKRVVLLKQPKFMSQKVNKEEEARLLDYLKDPNPETVFIFVLGGIDKLTAFIKNIATECESYLIKAPSKEGLKGLFLQEAKKRKKNIDASAIFYLLEKSKQLSLLQLIGEIEKASLYTKEDEALTQKSLEQVAIPTVDETIFTLLDGVFEKNLKKAYQAWQELSFMGEPVPKVIYQLIDGSRRLLLIKGLLEEGKNAPEIESYLQKHPYVIKKGISQLRSLKAEALSDCLAYLLRQDIALKSLSGLDDKGLMEDVLTHLILKLSK